MKKITKVALWVFAGKNKNITNSIVTQYVLQSLRHSIDEMSEKELLRYMTIPSQHYLGISRIYIQV